MNVACKKCGAPFEQTPSQVRKQHVRCPSCIREYNIEYRARRVAQGLSAHAQTPERRAESIKKYYKTHRAEIAAKFRERWYDPANSMKNAAQRKARDAIYSGNLARQPCEVCGAAKVHAHHDDYSKPLDVRWLCFKHHMQHHAALKKSVCDVEAAE